MRYTWSYDCSSYMFYYGYGDHRDLHVLTHAFPTRRFSYLADVLHLALVHGLREAAHGATLHQQRDGKCVAEVEVGGERVGRKVKVGLRAVFHADGDRKSTRLNSSH